MDEKLKDTTMNGQDALEDMLWVSQVRAGDRQMFSEVVTKYQRPVHTICYRFLRNELEAEDAAQEVFIRAFFKLDTYDENRSFSRWLYAIATHYCIDLLKKRRLALVLWGDLSDNDQLCTEYADQPEALLLAAEKSQEVDGLLQNLRPDYRTTLTLKYLNEMSCKEMAQTLQTSVSAVKSKLFRARRKMARVVRRQNSQRKTGWRPHSANYGDLFDVPDVVHAANRN